MSFSKTYVIALLLVLAACSEKDAAPSGNTGADASIDSGVSFDAASDASPGDAPEAGEADVGTIAGFVTDPINAADVGRYWARARARGRAASSALTVWFEHKPATQGWSDVTRTPEQHVGAGTENALLEEWLIGLAPGAPQDVRTCYRDEAGAGACSAPESFATKASTALRWVRVDPADPKQLAFEDGERFVVWGSNYVGPTGGSVHLQFEDAMYDAAGLALIEADLTRLANVAPPDGVLNALRMHLQLHTFLIDATTPKRSAFAHFAKVIELVEDKGLYVMVTGLNYFYPADNPLWIATQTEAEHWTTQAIWWNAMAGTLRHSPGVFAYDLMNEPYSSGGSVVDGYSRWTTVAHDKYCDYGANADAGIHGTCFGQYVSNGLAGRTPDEIAAAWTRKMKDAIRFTQFVSNDTRHLVTVGVGAFGLNNSFHRSPGVHQELEFLSPHLYPDGADKGDAQIALAAELAKSGKPVIAGETFTFGPADRLISRTCHAGTIQGWFGQYDGRRLGDPCPPAANVFGCALFDAWYQIQASYGPTFRAGNCPPLLAHSKF
jgi:hypothetical protein